MNEEQVAVVKEYIEVKSKIKALTAQAKEMESGVVSTIKEAEGKTVKSELGVLSIVVRKSWTYSPTLVDSEKAVGIRYEDAIKEHKEDYELDMEAVGKKKIIEEADGTATVKETEGLRFQAK